MLAHIRHHLATVLASTTTATLASTGPAGLQAENVPCAAAGLRLRLLVPRTSDQLLNLEADVPVVVTTSRWQMWGVSHMLTDAEWPAAASSLPSVNTSWYMAVEVRPSRVAIVHPTGWGAAETYDVEQGAD